MTLPELLLAALVIALLASLGLGAAGRSLARTRVEAAARQLTVVLEQARSGAETRGLPCALALSSQGWVEPTGADLDAELPPCPVRETPLPQEVRLQHNLPSALRISSNGLVLDGGTVVLSGGGSDLQRCLVIALPLGMVRMGRSTAATTALPRSSDCVVDPSL